MPELPEVEVVKRSLKKKLINLLIKKVDINTYKLRYTVDRKKFNKIVNKKVLSISRRSKYILINLQKNLTIIAHLGMTGKFFIIDKNKKKKTSFYYDFNTNDNKHNHIIFTFNKNIKLIYNDVRKFGFLKIVATSNLRFNSHIRLLGPEPLSKLFNLKYFENYIVNKKKKLKNILMDQKFVSGLGNIYVNEILCLSKLDPRRGINDLKKNDLKKIISFTKKILKKSIHNGGSSVKNFNDSNGKNGNFQQCFQVYAREGRKCFKNSCTGIIKKIIISSRSTFICKTCQK